MKASVTLPCAWDYCEGGAVEIELQWEDRTVQKEGHWIALHPPRFCPMGHPLTVGEQEDLWQEAQELAAQRPAPLEEPQLWDCEELS